MRLKQLTSYDFLCHHMCLIYLLFYFDNHNYPLFKKIGTIMIGNAIIETKLL